MKRWFHVIVDYAAWGFASDENNKIVDAAPIGSWMIGKKLSDVKPWLLKKKAIVTEVK